jgi:hypothetical protein
LIIPVGQAEKLIVIYLNDKRYFMGIFPAHQTQYTIGRGDPITTTFHGQFNDIFRIKINGVRGKRRTGAVFYALVYREDGTISGISQFSMAEQRLYVPEHCIIPVTVDPYFIYMIWGGQVKSGFFNGVALMVQQVLSFVAKEFKDLPVRHKSWV